MQTLDIVVGQVQIESFLYVLVGNFLSLVPAAQTREVASPVDRQADGAQSERVVVHVLMKVVRARCACRYTADKALLTDTQLLPVILLDPFNDLFARTTCVSQYQEGKTGLDLN